MTNVAFGEVKEAFLDIYGPNPIVNPQFEDFDDAFVSAWESFDFFAGEGDLTPTTAAESMASMWQFSE